MSSATIHSDLPAGKADLAEARSDFRKYSLILVSSFLVFFQAHGQSGAWTPKTSMPIQAGSACVVNGNVYVIGGAGNGPGFVDLATNEVYYPSTDAWETKEPMPTPRGFLSTAVANDTIYAIGGGYPTSKDKVEAYDPVTNTWTTKKNMLGPRLGAQAAVVAGIIYNIGGNYNQRNCEAYDPATNTWTAKTPIPQSGGVLSLTIFNGLIYAFGGSTYSPWGALSSVYAYDPNTDTWTKKRDMPTARFALQTYVVGGKIYAIGGSQRQGNALATVEVYDPVSDTWEAKPNMPDNLAWSAGAVVNDKIYVIGGTSDWMSVRLTLWEYDPFFHTDIAAGNVCGIWSLANSPYHINGEITIPNDSTLTIEPGVEVVFMGHYKFNVQGRLLAVGTPQDTIRFTAEDTGTGWHGIRFINTPSTNDTSRLIHCSFKYGKANTGVSNSLDRCGGAIMINAFDKVYVSNCLFEHNMTSGEIESTGGPGVCIFYGSPTVTRSTFVNNDGALGSAGAIKIDFASTAVISNNVVSNNTSYCGAIICAYQTDNRPTISGNVISKNVATGGGGGILVYNSSKARIENNIITNNQAPLGGGIYCLNNVSPVLVNNTIVYNTAGSNGGGISCELNSDPILMNNIVYGNSATAGGQIHLADPSSNPTVGYSDIQGGWVGVGNIDADPQFVDGDPMFDLKPVSPCIGRGIDSLDIGGVWYYAPTCDCDGHGRPSPGQGQGPDMGAQEEQVTLDVEETTGIPTSYMLGQNYPNPFNPTTAVSFQLPAVSDVKLVVYDILGREVEVLVNEKKNPGRYEVHFDASRLASGVYFYRLEAGQFVSTKKLVVLR
jgi:parallel beta-helix repeat protein